MMNKQHKPSRPQPQDKERDVLFASLPSGEVLTPLDKVLLP